MDSSMMLWRISIVPKKGIYINIFHPDGTEISQEEFDALDFDEDVVYNCSIKHVENMMRHDEHVKIFTIKEFLA
jgi:hypothetical protein